MSDAPTKSFYRVMLGKKSIYAEECFAGSFIGTDFGIGQDLIAKLPEEWKEFNREFIPLYMQGHPGATKIGAGLCCGALWTVSKGISKGDTVLCPDGRGSYLVGEVTGGYSFEIDGVLPHRRPVRWLDMRVARASMSEALQNSAGSIGTVSNISKYRDELSKLIGGALPNPVVVEEGVEDLAAFNMEKHLEDFLVQNWAQTELGRDYDLYSENGELVGQQYPTDTGPLDLLAISKDKKVLLVVELKKGRASDAVVGQILRYMGFVQEELAEAGQTVRGVVIALEDDQRIRRALSVVASLSFYRYQISFKLVKA